MSLFHFQIEKVIEELAANKEDDLTLIDYKFEFLQIICEYEHFVPLNYPVPDTIVSVPKLQQSFAYVHSHGVMTSVLVGWLTHIHGVTASPVFSKRHFLSSLVMAQVAHYLTHKEHSVRMKAMTAMRRIFIAHDFDVRYDDPAIKTRVINVFFPFILTAIDHRPAADATHVEQREFLICLLFLLKNVDPSLLQQWWRKETATRLGGLFDILATAVRIFEWNGAKEWRNRMQEGSNAKKGDDAKVL